MKIYYNTSKQCLVDEFNCQINSKPVLFFGEQPVWQLRLYQSEVGSEPENTDISGIASWRAAVDSDWDSKTEPMCRTVNGIAHNASTGLLTIPLNANTVSFLDKLENRKSRDGYLEIRGYNYSGNVAMVIIIGIICHNTIDPEGDDELDVLDSNTASKGYVEALLAGKANVSDVYTKDEIDGMINNLENELAEI